MSRCRKKKTKCSGSVPCERCVHLDAAEACTFEDTNAQTSVFERIKALEDCVSRLLNTQCKSVYPWYKEYLNDLLFQPTP